LFLIVLDNFGVIAFWDYLFQQLYMWLQMFVNLDKELGERFDFWLELGILTIFLQQISNFTMRDRELLL
jgi:hypothetical protein